MAATLEQLVAEARQRVALQPEKPLAKGFAREPRDFRRALGQKVPAIIAELKKASPSRGVIREDFDPLELAQVLEEAGAAALSVLTEEKHFQGSIQTLATVSGQVSIPCLRKDFIVDSLQIDEARANGADAILLIVAALSDQELRTLKSAAHERQLDILCEVHDESELDRALSLGFEIIGVNSRDLKTFNVDLNTALRLGPRIPKNVVAVAESGICCHDDLKKVMDAGFHAALIGESLMRTPDPGLALRSLLGST